MRTRPAQVNDTIVYDIASGKVTEHIKFDLGQVRPAACAAFQGSVGAWCLAGCPASPKACRGCACAQVHCQRGSSAQT